LERNYILFNGKVLNITEVVDRIKWMHGLDSLIVKEKKYTLIGGLIHFRAFNVYNLNYTPRTQVNKSHCFQ